MKATTRCPAPGSAHRPAVIVLAAVALSTVLGSCATGAGASAIPSANGRPATIPSATPPSISGWKALPEPARSAGLEFSRRVSAGDWEWVRARAEPAFIEAYPASRDGAFFARLTRSGELSAGGPAEGLGFEPLDLRGLTGVRFEEARVEGPVAILYGHYLRGTRLGPPFALHVLWRLEPPRFLGILP